MADSEEAFHLDVLPPLPTSGVGSCGRQSSSKRKLTPAKLRHSNVEDENQPLID